MAWARRVGAWLDDAIGPDAVIRNLELHLDERSPHLHGDVVPLVRDERGLKRSREAVAARMIGHPSAKGPAVMRAIQDRYYENVSQPFGLGRGGRSAPSAGTSPRTGTRACASACRTPRPGPLKR